MCRSRLISWSKRKFKACAGEIEDLMGQVGEMQNNWVANAEAIQEMTIRVDKLREQDESFWQQRSRVKWLREGDANTAFFHLSTLQQRRNKVGKVRRDDGGWEENPSGVKRLIDDYFINLFKTEGPQEWEQVLECITPSVTECMNHELLLPITEEEIEIAAHQMGDLKAPGPDGFQGVLYHSFWNSIVKEVTEMVLFLSKGDRCPGQLNATHIILIPKVLNPESVSQFRLISLCNFSYKMFSKVLANRLKPLLPKIISPMQNAFVGGRQIQDNIGIAHELFHFLKLRKTKSKFELGIKLDMNKACDLDAVMERMGFHHNWRRIITGCVNSVNFAVLLNGQPGNKFVPSRGLRQGDPLSLYLFLMVSDVLSRLIFRRLTSCKGFRYILMARPFPISSLSTILSFS